MVPLPFSQISPRTDLQLNKLSLLIIALRENAYYRNHGVISIRGCWKGLVGFGLVFIDFGKGSSGLCPGLDAGRKQRNSVMGHLTKSCVEGGETRVRLEL